MNIQTLKALMDDVSNDIVCKDKAKIVKKFRVDIMVPVPSGRYGWSCTRKDVNVSDPSIMTNDPRIVACAISMLKSKQLNRLGITIAQLKALPFEAIEIRQGWTFRLECDSRYLTGDAEDVNVQRALGIKDENPIHITVRER